MRSPLIFFRAGSRIPAPIERVWLSSQRTPGARAAATRAASALSSENTWCARPMWCRRLNLTAVAGGIIKAESMVNATGDSNASVFGGSLHRRPSAPSSIGVPTE